MPNTKSPVQYGQPVEPKVEYPEWMQPVEYRAPVDTVNGREQLLSYDGELDCMYRGAPEPYAEDTDRWRKDAEARRELVGGLPDAPGEAVAVQGGKPFRF